MSLKLRWVGEDELDRVAETRMYCYAPSSKDLERYKTGIRADGRGKPGDFLLGERNGTVVGTSTSLSMVMWVRGAPLPCQGVAYVGTIRTHRRGGSGERRGIASQIMVETLRKARERGEVLSALMPFRVSYYEHFGYGVVETRNEWTVPLSILPSAEFDFRFVLPDDHPAMADCRRRIVESGQCDMERSAAGWANFRRWTDEGYEIVDRGADGVVHGWLSVTDAKVDGRSCVRVDDQGYDSPDALRRQLGFLASLRDQYWGAIITLPKDVPLSWLLRERQIPHRPVEHPVSRLRPYTRMQVRVLNHKRFLEALKLPRSARGRAVVAVHECEQTVSKFRVEISDGRAQVSDAHDPADIECADTEWAAVACGEISATRAAAAGLIRTVNPDALPVLDALAVGPAPFCAEYF